MAIIAAPSVFRLLLTRPGLTAARLVLVSALVGVGAAVFAVADATLIRPFRFPEPSRLARVVLLAPGITDPARGMPLHALTFQRLRESAAFESFEGIWTRERAIGGDTEPESVSAASVTGGVFPLLGAQATAGRLFDEQAARTNAKVAVLSHRLWVRRFNASHDVVGRTILIDREPFEIVGVVSDGTHTKLLNADVWTPLYFDPADNGNRLTYVVTLARLKREVTLREANERLRPLLTATAREAPGVAKGFDLAVLSLPQAVFGQQRAAILLLVAAVAALALLATANLANLTLADVLGRQRDLAARLALGASVPQLLAPEIVRSVTVAIAAGIIGLLVAHAVVPGLQTLAGTALVNADIRIGPAVVLVMLCFSLLVMVSASALPVLRVAGGDIQRTLLAGGRGAAGSRESAGIRRLLLAAQSALGVLMLSVTAMVLGGFLHASQLDPGFAPEGLAAAQLRLPASTFPTARARSTFVNSVVEQLRNAPGVVSAAASGAALIPNFLYTTLVDVEAQPSADNQPHTFRFRRVSASYFETMGIVVRAGRTFDSRDGEDGQLVAMVNASFARRFWPGRDPIGQRIRRVTPNPQWSTVVGVVDDSYENGLGQPPAETIYVPFAQNNSAGVPVVVIARTADGRTLADRDVAAAVRRVDPQQPVDRVMPMTEFIDASIAAPRFQTVLLTTFGGLALLIASLGTYSVTARGVNERTREIGIRLALGGTPGGIWRSTALQSLRSVAAGCLAGGTMAMVAAPLISRVLPDVTPGALAEIAASFALLLGVAGAAAFGAAARAARLRPLEALRAGS